MTRNESNYLKKCVESIINTVTIPYHIYIIDNKSSEAKHNEILAKIEQNYSKKINVIRNKSNLWILGLNKTLLELFAEKKQKYFFLTDGDIDFSACQAKPCWLSYLVSAMDNNTCIGKIGITLNWDYISGRKELSAIYQQEKNLYNENKKINDLYVSPVDTTAALFRWDWSIEGKPGLYPDHIRYLRPELYSCRTPFNINVIHMGWFQYGEIPVDKRNIKEKIACFTLVGGDVKDEVLNQTTVFYRLLYKCLSGPMKKLWYFRRYYYLLRYMLLKGIRQFDGQNSI